LKENDCIDFAEFKEVISEISEEFHTTFKDFDSLNHELQLLKNPMDIEVTQQPFDLQMECVIFCRILFFFSLKNESWEVFGKCCLKRISPSFEISPVTCCHYLEEPMFVKLHFPL